MFGTGAAAVETTETAAGCGCCPRCVVDAVVDDGYDDYGYPPIEYGPADIEWLEADGDWSAEPARPVPEEIDMLPPGRPLADLLEQLPARSAPPGAGRWAEPVDHGADEIAAALSWTSLAAGCQLAFAERLTRRLPAVYQAMLAGQIDYPKAKVFVDLLGTDDDIDPKVVAVVV